MDIVALTHYGDISMFVCKILIAVISVVVGYPAIWMKVRFFGNLFWNLKYLFKF